MVLPRGARRDGTGRLSDGERGAVAEAAKGRPVLLGDVLRVERRERPQGQSQEDRAGKQEGGPHRDVCCVRPTARQRVQGVGGAVSVPGAAETKSASRHSRSNTSGEQACGENGGTTVQEAETGGTHQ